MKNRLNSLFGLTATRKSLLAAGSALLLLAGCSDSNPIITDPQSADLDITLSESESETAPAIAEAQSDVSTRRPDIVLVVSDDQRWDLMSARGHQYVKTPNLDAMASTGAMMENAFVPVALCSPSRGALLTGRDVHKASAPRIVWKNNSFIETQRTMAEDMQAAGYTTAYVGKWHLGEGSKPKRGFDHWESFDWLGQFFDPTIYINGEKKQFEGFVDDILAERATAIIKASEDSDKPLFLVVGLKEPHLWFEHPPRRNNDFADVSIPRPDTFNEDFAESGKLQEIKDWLGISNFHCGLNCFDEDWDTYIRFHYRAIQGLDDAIGTIRNGINDGLQADNTLFIYTSDNGYSLGDHGLTEKHFVYEEPIRVPLLVDAPGSDDAGRRPNELVSVIDIAPTVLDYAGIDIPPQMTGRSMRTLISNDSGGEATSNSDAPASAATWRDQLFFMYEKAQVAVRTADFKLIRSLTVDGHFELYDLVNDPKETRTVYSDPAYASARQEMHRRLKSIIEDNQWSARETYPVRNVLASQPIPTELADRLSQELSATSASAIQEGVIDIADQTLQFENMPVGTGNFGDRFPLKEEANSNDGQSVLVVLPMELLTDWDPFIEVKVRRRTQAAMYHAGRELWNNTAEERLPLDAANPPLFQGADNFVVLRFDDTGAMDVKLEIESPEDTLRLPLEERLLGNAPGRFDAIGGWQAHNDVEISRETDALILRSAGSDAQLQTENVYADQPVHVVIEYSADEEIPASVFWRSQHSNYAAERKVALPLPAGSNNLATLNLEGVSPEATIDALRLDLDAEDAAIRMHALSVYPLGPDGSVGTEPLHLWRFN